MKKTLLVLLLLSLPATFFLIKPGGYEPHDFHHIADVWEMGRAISSGQIMPRLGPDFMFGAGYPLFNYYYVLPFYIGALFLAITGSLMASLKLVFLFSVLLSVLGMYLFTKRFVGNISATVASILYLYTPFRAVEIYVRGAIGEALAIAILPWVFFGITLLIREKTKWSVSFLAIIFALFILTHNYFFVLSSPFILLYIFVLLASEKKKVGMFLRFIISGLLGLGLAAFWWLPAFLEYKLVAAGTPFNLTDHFPFIKQLLLPSWGYGSSVWGPGDEISFQIGIVNLIVVALALVLILLYKKRGDIKFKLLTWGLLSFFVCVFMMNIRSLFIWNIVPFTNFIQFPWRLLSFTAFFSAFLSGIVVEKFKNKKIIGGLILGAAIFFTFSYFRPSKTLTRTNKEYLAHFFGNPQYSEDYLQLPIGAEKRFDASSDQKFKLLGEGDIISVQELSSVHWIANTRTEEGTDMEIAALNFPGWFVTVDGVPIKTSSGKPYGQIEFSLEKGTHKVELYWRETSLRLIADLLSLGSLAIVAYLYFRSKAHATI